jgi:hypothetical protein
MKLLILTLLMVQSAWSYDILAPKRIKSELVTAYSENVVLDIYKSIGIKAKIVFLPEHEINLRIKNNNYDAILSKIADHASISNSLQISPPLIRDYKVFRWTLKNTNQSEKRFRVGAIKGVMAHTKTVIANRAKFKGIKYFTTYAKMVQALKKKTIDSVLLSQREYTNELSKEIKSALDMKPKMLLKTNLNHYINEKHQSLYNKITQEFKKRDLMKKLSFNDFQKVFQTKKTKTSK